MSDYDSPWKEVLDSWFEDFLAFFFAEAHAGIDWSRGHEALDKELRQVVPTAEHGRRVVDKLVRVWRLGGQEEWVLVHVEVQGKEEAGFGRRMYVYNYRLFDRYNRTVVSLAVLGDDRPGWRPDAFGYDLWGCSVSFRYPVVKLLDYADDVAALEASKNPFATVVLAHLKTRETRRDPESRRAWKLRLVKGLYERGWGEKDVQQLILFIDWVMDLPKELEKSFRDELQQYEEEKRMPYVSSFERIGREEGLREGLLEGIKLGLELKFGAAGLQVLPAIQQLTDVDVLRTISQALRTVGTLEELQRIWTS